MHIFGTQDLKVIPVGGVSSIQSTRIMKLPQYVGMLSEAQKKAQ